MFGGYGIYLDETFMAIVARGALWFKVDGENLPDYEALEAPPFRPWADRDTALSYREVPAAVLEDRHALAHWAARALEAARRAAAETGPRSNRRRWLPEDR